MVWSWIWGHPRRVDGSIDLNRPFLTRRYRAAGGDPSRLRNREFRCVFRGVWIRSEAYDEDSARRAALLLHPEDAFLSHLSAAAVLGLPVPDHPFIHVTVSEHKDRRYRPQIKPHVTGRTRRVIAVRGMRVTDPIATFIDSAGMLSFVDLVVLGDALCRRYRISADALRKACAESTDYYAGLARAAAEFVRDAATGCSSSPRRACTRSLLGPSTAFDGNSCSGVSVTCRRSVTGGAPTSPQPEVTRPNGESTTSALPFSRDRAVCTVDRILNLPKPRDRAGCRRGPAAPSPRG